ncbi:SRPBCC family protein [bacterium]|nr:SRPBCC family protein [bacterium]
MSRNSRRFTYNNTFTVNKDADSVFALLGPEEEKDWLSGWDCEMMHPGPGSAVETDAVAISHPGTEMEAVWVVVDRDTKQHKLDLVRVQPNKLTLHLRIEVVEENGVSTVTWDMTLTALNDSAATEMAASHPAVVAEAVSWIAESLNHYFRTGSKLAKLPAHP